MVKDFKYIIKRIIIGVGIALLLSFFRGNLFIMAHALTSHTDSIELCATNLGCNTQAYAPVSQAYANSGTITFTNVSLQQNHTYSMNFYMTLTTPSFSFASGSPRMYVNPGGVRAYPDRNENLFVNRTGNNTYSITWSFDLDNTGGTFSTASISYEFSSNYNGTLYSTTVNSVSLDYTDITGGTGSSNDDIINNATSNTQNIINNANNNSQNIINNANNNAQAIQDTIIDNNQSCSFSFKIINSSTATKKDVFIGASGNFTSNTGFTTTEYISITANNDYTLNYSYSNVGSAVAYCLYNSSKVKISCSLVSQQNSFNSGKARYLTVSVRNGSTNKATLSGFLCQNKIDKTTDAVNNMNDTLKLFC